MSLQAPHSPERGWRIKTIQPRLFWGSFPVRPADVSAAMGAAMLARDSILEDVQYHKIVPNQFVVEVSTENFEKNYRPIERRIVKQWSEKLLEQLMTANSRQGRKEYRFGGSVQISIRAAEDLQGNHVRILYRIQPNEPESAPTPPADLSGACLEMPLTRRRWLLHPGVVTIGRDLSCDIQLDLPEVQGRRLISSQHAHLRQEGGGFRLFDGSPSGKPSTNGTFVNSQRVPPGGRPLAAGDVIILASPDPTRPIPDAPGSVTLHFLADCAPSIGGEKMV